MSDMSIFVEVGLLSDKTAVVEAHFDEDVETFKGRARTALGVGNGRLVDSFGSVLDASAPIKGSILQKGHSLTLQISPVRVCGTARAFAAILGDGSITTWGAGDISDSSAVQDQLKNVQRIQATYSAFAAILGDGSVATWGSADRAGDSTAVQDQLKNVQNIQASSSAFAAVLGDGSVVTWGSADHGGDSGTVQDQLKNVRISKLPAALSLPFLAMDLSLPGEMQPSFAFAAIVADGSVVTSGDADYGCDSSAVQDQLRNVQQIPATQHAFAAIVGDGSVVTWGDADCGGDSSDAQDQLRHVQKIQASHGAFAAILGDGSVV